MKIDRIQTKNFLGARDVDLKLTKPVCLVVGPNGSGKSSLHEAVRQALTGESVRVHLKKDYHKLVADGADVGFCVVEHDGQHSAITLPNGAHEHTGQGLPSPLLSFCLDAQRFSRLDANDRRKFLFGLMGLQTDGPSVTDRLTAKGCDPDKIGQIAPFLRSGFDAAHKESQARARDAKASWRAVTGETYGGTKAITWRAPKPPTNKEAMQSVKEEIDILSQQVSDGTSAVGEMHGRAKAQAEQSARLSGLRERAGKYARIADKLRRDEAELKEWQEKVEQEEGKMAQANNPVGPTYTCPSCAATLRHHNGALVVFHQQQDAVAPSDAQERLREYRNARDLFHRSVENDNRDLAIADSAAKALAEIESSGAEPAPAPEEIAEAAAGVAATKKELAAMELKLKELYADVRLAEQADRRTEAAQLHHRDVAQWESVADALAPSGIPGELLSEALGPINERLATSSSIAEWLRVGIQSDMTITADGGRPYALLSESEKWRADAMIAEAIANLSGIRVLTLDRFDVLDIKGREDLLYWLDELADNGDLDTALITGTLKGLPARLPERIEAHWIENGLVPKIREAA
jgi:energy-coupling factor transporter ATP-binding protein EcfA2